MDVLLIIAAVGIMCILCFIVGAKVGQAVTKGEKVEMPDINPLNAIKEHADKRQMDKEQRQIRARTDAIMHNIDVYDGTSVGQKDVPRG